MSMSIELDVVFEEPLTLEQTLATIPADIAVTHEVLTLEGPGGGWPLVKFTGERDALKALLADWYGGELELEDLQSDTQRAASRRSVTISEAEQREILQGPSEFRKKPVVIQAMQFDGTKECADRILAWIATFREVAPANPIGIFVHGDLRICTLEGNMCACKGYWIIRGVKDEIYPCKDDIFHATYEAAGFLDQGFYSAGLERIVSERRRQVEVEGLTIEGDAQRGYDPLIRAAIAYLQAQLSLKQAEETWAGAYHKCTFKPTTPLRNFEKAGALVAAAIDVTLKISADNELEDDEDLADDAS